MILYTKNPTTQEWEPVPAIKGTSVYLTAGPTTFSDQSGTGWTWDLYDEVSNATTSMKVYNGADGTGSGTVTAVDGISPGAQGTVVLNAIRYVTQSLSTDAKAIARNNIDAMKNVASASNGQVLTYNTSTSSWVAATPQSIVAPSASSQMLYSTSSSVYAWTSFSAITSNQIDSLFT